MIIIILAILIVFVVSSVWIWHCLGNIEKNQKILFIIIGFIIVFICTFIVFQISKSGIVYENKNIENDVRNMIVSIFTGANSLILLPYVARQLNKIKTDEIEKEKLKNKMFFIMFIFIICLILESGYMRDVQAGILKVYQAYREIV